MRKRAASCLLSVACSFLVGCSGMMSRSLAAEKLKAQFELEQVFFGFNIGRVGTKCAIVYTRGGLVNDDPDHQIQLIAGVKAGLVTVKPDGGDFWRVELTDLGRSFTRWWKKAPRRQVGNGCDYQYAPFHIAKRELVAVTGISENKDGTEDVEYQWKWIPSDAGTRISAALSPEERSALEQKVLNPYSFFPAETPFTFLAATQDDHPHPGKLTFKKYDDGWRLFVQPPHP